MRILIEEAGVDLTAEFNDSATAALLVNALPLGEPGRHAGRRAYFSVPATLALRTHKPPSTWYRPLLAPRRRRLPFFVPQPVSPVNLIGTLEGEPNVLEAVRDGLTVRLERIKE